MKKNFFHIALTSVLKTDVKPLLLVNNRESISLL